MFGLSRLIRKILQTKNYNFGGAPTGKKARGEENGEEVPLLIWLWGPFQWGPEQSPGRKWFYCK